MLKQGMNAVLVSQEEIQTLASSWPCSGLRGSKVALKVFFAENGDLVDLAWIDTKTLEETAEPEGADGQAVLALAQDAWAFLEARRAEERARVYALSIGAWGTIINTRTGEEFGGTIYTLRLDDQTLTPDGLLYCRPEEIARYVITPKTGKPFEIKEAQFKAVERKFWQNSDGAADFSEFQSRVVYGRDYLMLPWCGMWLGIELDGYTHS